MNKILKVLLIFALTYIVLFLINYLGIFGKWTSITYSIGIIPFFFMTYFVFEYLQKEVEFNFNEPYVGFLLLTMMWLSFWIAFRIYYGNIATLNGIDYSTFYTNANLNMFSYLINNPYIYIALSSFCGWVAFALTSERNTVPKRRK